MLEAVVALEPLEEDADLAADAERAGLPARLPNANRGAAGPLTGLRCTHLNVGRALDCLGYCTVTPLSHATSLPANLELIQCLPLTLNSAPSMTSEYSEKVSAVFRFGGGEL